MDIRNWPLDRIMQLPDCCFGRRWPIGLSAEPGIGLAAYDICEYGLPERFVVWEILVYSEASVGADLYFQYALGDKLPATAAEFNELELLMGGIISGRGVRSEIGYARLSVISLVRLRHLVIGSGRRIVVQFTNEYSEAVRLSTILVISSVPTEVPDWFISGPARSL